MQSSPQQPPPGDLDGTTDSLDVDSQPLVLKRRTSRNLSVSLSRESISSSVTLPRESTSHVREIERSNLTCLMRLIVKHLLETAMRQNRVIEATEVPLVNFFVSFENLMCHGLKHKKNLLGVNVGKDVWPVLELVSSLRPEASELCKSARDMPHIRTGAGRTRAWIRMAFMQKRLSDYFHALIDRKDLLADFYEEEAFLMSDEATVVAGLLIGLSVIECNQWCARDDRLDVQTSVVDLRYYFKSNGSSFDVSEADDEISSETKDLLDQKNYLEELNRKLTATVTQLRQKLSSDVDNNFEVLVEGSTSSSNSMPNGQASVSEAVCESAACERVRKELESLTHSSEEMSMAMKLLEKDVHEKQDTIISIRRQLEDIKAINIQMFHKIKTYESEMKEKDSKIAKLDQKVASCLKKITQLETKVKSCEDRKNALEELKEQQEKEIKVKEEESSSFEKSLKEERERRSSLKKLLDEQEAEIARLSTELEEAKHNLSEFTRLRKEFLVLQRKCSEYELSLEEVGGQLKETKLEVDNLRESSLHLKEAFWMKDSDVSECFQCESVFTLSKRKHHCRNCGRIFCSNCSDNKMSLASSDKPVRVCDSCQTMLLDRCSVK